MRVLVTGGSGFIGSHVVDELVSRDHDVVSLDALHPGAHIEAPGYLNPSADHRVADLRDADAVGDAVRGVDAVSHQASMVGLGVDFRDAPDYVSNNDLGTAVLLRCLHDEGFDGPIALASSMVVYGEGTYRCAEDGEVRPGPRSPADLDAGRFDPPCPDCGRPLVSEPVDELAIVDPRNVYAATKLHQEHLLAAFAREHGSRAAALRYHNVYGSRMPRDTPYAGVASVFRSALERGAAPRVFEDGGQRRDFVHVSDVARANALALEAGVHGPFNIATGEPRTVGEMAQTLAEAFGPRAPAPEAVGGYRLGDVRHVFASPEKAAVAFGFRAEVGFAEGMRRFATDPLRECATDRVAPSANVSVRHASTRDVEPRVSLLTRERAPLAVRRFFEHGDPGPITASLAHVPELLQVALPFFGMALAGVTLDPRTAELVIVRASSVLRCRYCTLTHGAIALDAGVSPEEVRSLCDPSPDSIAVFTDARETALLAWVDEVAAGRGTVPEDVAARLAGSFDEATVVELTAMVGCTILLNRYCSALRLPPAESSLARLRAAGLDPSGIAA